MTFQLIGISILAAAILTGCGPGDSTPPTAAEQREANDAKVATDIKAAADTLAAADTKAATDIKAAADTLAAADTKAATDIKAATATLAAADIKAAADTKSASDIRDAADLKAAVDTKAVTDTKITADLKTAADDAAKAAADENTAKATSLVTLLLQYISDGKLELAGATLIQLDDMEGVLPAPLLEKIQSARSALSAKKAEAEAEAELSK